MTQDDPFGLDYWPDALPVVALGEGRRAAMCGESRLENRYRPGTTAYEAWNKGYDNQVDRLRDEDRRRGERE